MTINTQYSYGIIKDNNPYFAQETVLLDNKYKKSAKYALIEKIAHKDGSENISRIVYGRLGITATHRKIENCKKSELKNI